MTDPVRRRSPPGTNPRKDKAPCKVDGCTRTVHYSSGLCSMHHRRLQRKGDVGTPGSPRAPKKRTAP
jgi:hypothetical protein